MKWRIPAALFLICVLGLVIAVRKLQESNNDLTWMISFSAMLLSGFGVLFSGVWTLVAIDSSNPLQSTHTSKPIPTSKPKSDGNIHHLALWRLELILSFLPIGLITISQAFLEQPIDLKASDFFATAFILMINTLIVMVDRLGKGKNKKITLKDGTTGTVFVLLLVSVIIFSILVALSSVRVIGWYIGAAFALVALYPAHWVRVKYVWP